jgi:hypothetical protein
VTKFRLAAKLVTQRSTRKTFTSPPLFTDSWPNSRPRATPTTAPANVHTQYGQPNRLPRCISLPTMPRTTHFHNQSFSALVRAPPQMAERYTIRPWAMPPGIPISPRIRYPSAHSKSAKCRSCRCGPEIASPGSPLLGEAICGDTGCRSNSCAACKPPITGEIAAPTSTHREYANSTKPMPVGVGADHSTAAACDRVGPGNVRYRAADCSHPAPGAAAVEVVGVGGVGAGVVVGVGGAAGYGVGLEEAAGGGVVETDAHEGEVVQGVGGALFGAEPAPECDSLSRPAQKPTETRRSPSPPPHPRPVRIARGSAHRRGSRARAAAHAGQRQRARHRRPG